MATNKRMFCNDVVGSDAFFEMPPSTQALYFQLGMRADDDGFVNPKMVMRLVGSTEDELRVLIAKKFVLPFENGVFVIKHWGINNNKIQKDRYKPTLYTEQKKLLFIKDNGAYTLDEKQGIPCLLTECTQNVNNSLPQNRIEENRIEENINTISSPVGDGHQIENKKEATDGSMVYSSQFLSFWGSFPRKTGKGNAWKSWQKIKGVNSLTSKIIESVEEHKARDLQWKKDGGQYIPHPATFLNQRRWEDELEVETLKEKVTRI